MRANTLFDTKSVSIIVLLTSMLEPILFFIYIKHLGKLNRKIGIDDRRFIKQLREECEDTEYGNRKWLAYTISHQAESNSNITRYICTFTIEVKSRKEMSTKEIKRGSECEIKENVKIKRKIREKVLEVLENQSLQG